MAPGFLSSALSGIGRGVKSGAGFLGRGLGKLNGMGMGDEDEESGGVMPGIMGSLGPGGTGGFAGNEGLPKMGRPMGGDTGLINRHQDMPNAMPQLQRPEAAPTMEPLKESLNVSANLPMGEASVSPLAGQMIPQREIREVRPPDFLGRPGATMEDAPMNHERYAYDNQYMKEGRHRPRWQDITANIIHGGAQGFQQTGDWAGALGGAAAGGIGSAAMPLHARDFRFNKEQMSRMQANRAEFERGQDRNFELQKRGADLEGARARTAATIAGTKDAELERRYRQAQIEKTNAQTEAALLGKPVVKMITDENTGEIYEAQIYPDGRVERRGLSGAADLRQEGFRTREGIADKQIKSREGIADKQIGSREKIVGIQQRGATGRTGMTQAGADRRQKERLGAQYGDAPPVGSVPQGSPADSGGGSERRKAIIQRAIAAGYTPEQAAAEADKRGIK